MIITQRLRPNNPMQIRLHQLLHEINLSKLLDRRRLKYIEYADDVLVVEVPQELDLAECAQAEHRVIEGRDALDGYFALGGYVRRRAV